MGQSRTEDILENMLGASNELDPPQSRVESLLMELLESGGSGGGSGGGAGGGTDTAYVDLHDAFEMSVEEVAGPHVTLDWSEVEPNALGEDQAAAFGASNMYMAEIPDEVAAELYGILDVDAIAAIDPEDGGMVSFTGSSWYGYEPGLSMEARCLVKAGSELSDEAKAATGVGRMFTVSILKPGDGEPAMSDLVGQIDWRPGDGYFAMLDSTDARSVTIYPEGVTSADPVEVVRYAPKDGVARATASADGIMAAADKAKLDALDPDAIATKEYVDQALGVVENGSY